MMNAKVIPFLVLERFFKQFCIGVSFIFFKRFFQIFLYRTLFHSFSKNIFVTYFIKFSKKRIKKFENIEENRNAKSDLDWGLFENIKKNEKLAILNKRNAKLVFVLDTNLPLKYIGLLSVQNFRRDI